MSHDSATQLRRELLLIRAVELLLNGEVARLSREEARREWQEWDANEAVAVSEAAIGSVAELKSELAAARRDLREELSLLEAAPDRPAAAAEAEAVAPGD